MIRRKGQVTQRQIDRDFPHQVAIKLADRVREMHEFCYTRRHCQPRDRRSHVLGVLEHARFCFADRADADAFVAKFGGVRIRIKPRHRDAG